jgi:hypothetical protein
MIPRFLNILSILALVWGINVSVHQTIVSASLTAPGSTLIERTSAGIAELHPAADVVHSVYAQTDAGIQLVAGVLFITLGFFLHALARMRNGERPVHITVKPKAKRRMWYWIEMRI